MGAVTLSYYYCALLHPLLPLLLLSNCREERVATSGKRWLSAQCAAAAAVLPKVSHVPRFPTLVATGLCKWAEGLIKDAPLGWAQTLGPTG